MKCGRSHFRRESTVAYQRPVLLGDCLKVLWRSALRRPWDWDARGAGVRLPERRETPDLRLADDLPV